MTKVKVEFSYQRKLTFSKTVEVSQETADRLLALDGQDISQGSRIIYEENPDSVSNDDFTMIAEDLTDIHDVTDSMNEIEDFSIWSTEPVSPQKG